MKTNAKMIAIEIISFWNKLFDTENKLPPYWHPDDKKVIDGIDSYKDIKNYQDLINHTEFGKKGKEFEGKFHPNLLPVPYTGDITNAKVYILLLNPGFTILDYQVESKTDIKQKIISNIKQDGNNIDYPLIWLNPKYLWTGGGQWIEKKLKDIINEVVINNKLSYIEALKYISQQIAIIELVPYHSKSFNLPSKTIEKIVSMDSVTMIKKFVNGFVVNRVNKEEACIIVLSGTNKWGFSPIDNKIVVNDKGFRNPSLLKGTKGYEIIMEFIYKH